MSKTAARSAPPSRRHGWATLLAAALALVTLQMVGRWMPPLQSPDELSHLIRIASLSQGQWAPTTQAGASSGFSFDLGLAALARTFVPVIKDRNADVPPEDRALVREQGWTGSSLYGEAPGSASVLPLVYAPAALGLAIGSSLDWTIFESYHLARLVSQLACVLIMALAAWLWRPPLLAWAILLLPMSVFQMSAPVVDGPAHALTLLAMSMMMRLRARPSHVLTVSTVAVVLGLVTIRLHLFPLLLLLLWWGWQGLRGARSQARLATVAKSLAVSAATALVVCGLWITWVLTRVVDTRIQRPLSTGGVALHYLTHPLDLWGVVSRTFSDGDRLLFLADSFIGNLGWLDTRLPEEAYGLLWIGLGLLALMSWPWRDGVRGTSAARLAFVLCAFASVTIAFALMLLTWSPFPTEMIEGVQGRYFIAPAIVLAYALGTWPEEPIATPAERRRGAPAMSTGPQTWPLLQGLALAVFSAGSLWYLASTLMTRYPAWTHGSLWG